MSGAQAPLVEARAVEKRYGDLVVLSDLTCTVPAGVTGLLGANGAGKTTFLAMILGLHRPDGGSLSVLGMEPSDQGPEIRQLLGYGPEHHTLPPNLRASEFVKHIGEIHGLPPREATTRASDALWLVGLGEERFRAMGTMSTGQRQRVKLAQAIVHDPRLVLLDEPTDGLDPQQRDSMLSLIRTVAVDFNISIIVSSHLVSEVERVCDHAVVIGDGRVLTAGKVGDLRSQDGARLTADLDGSDEALADLVDALAVRLPAARIQRDGRAVTMEDPDGLAHQVLLDVCADHQVGLARLSTRRRSLEDVFVEHLS